MKTALLALLVGILPGAATKAPPPANEPRPLQLAAMCFKTGENAPPASMTKVCFYDCLGSPAAITISSTSLCPLTIQR